MRGLRKGVIPRSEPNEMSTIKTDCARCHGRGTISCTRCQGRGTYSIFSTTGTYFSANSSGFDACPVCKGIGELQCPACQGKTGYILEDSDRKELILKDTELSSGLDKQTDRTTARLVLAIHNLFMAAEADLSNKSAEIRFIRFLTDRNESDIKLKLTEICERDNPPDKRSKKVQRRSPSARKKDLQKYRKIL